MRGAIRQQWGFMTFKKFSPEWRQLILASEAYAIKALRQEGYTSIVNLNDILDQSYFDIKAELGGRTFVFQATMNSQPGRTAWHREYAKALNLIYKIIHIKPDLTGYFISDTAELSQRGVKLLKVVA